MINTDMIQANENKYVCTNCGGDATLAYVAETIKRGKDKGKQRAAWDGLVQPNERLCTSCFSKRGGKRIF